MQLENLPHINSRRNDFKAKKGKISGFGMFIREQCKFVKKEHPNLLHKDVFRIICEKWNKVEKVKKEEYSRKA